MVLSDSARRLSASEITKQLRTSQGHTKNKKKTQSRTSRRQQLRQLPHLLLHHHLGVPSHGPQPGGDSSRPQESRAARMPTNAQESHGRRVLHQEAALLQQTQKSVHHSLVIER